MISSDEIQNGLSGAWKLMLGKVEGLRQLDLSADGFWNSFFAMLVALPALFAIWTVSTVGTVEASSLGGRISILVRLAIIDVAAWVVPLAILALAARTLSMGDRFVHYVVASNWASAIIIWMMLPVLLIGGYTGPNELVDLASLVLFIVNLVLVWRLTNAALEKGGAIATAVFVLTIASSIAVIYGLEFLLAMPESARST